MSSNIKNHSHCSHKNELTIEFMNGGIYIYHNITDQEYKRLCSAKSMGKHLHEHIKNKYKFTKQ